MKGKNIYTAAIIGTGRIGFTLGFDKKREKPASHTMALLENKRIKIVAGCDTFEDSINQWKRYVSRFNRDVKAYATSEELLAAEKYDIIVIAVNEDSHLETALQAIAAQPRLIILEKPVALNTADGDKITKAAEKYGVPVLVNHERRFSEDYKIAKDYIEQGNLGKVMCVNARLDSGLRVYTKEEEATGAYSLLHDGTHLVDIVMFLLEKNSGEKEVLKKMAITNITRDEEKTDVVRNVTAHFESEWCPDVNISISGRSRYFGFEVDIIGTEGRIKIGNGIFNFTHRQQSKLYSGFYSLESDKKIRRPKKTRYFSNMIQNAVDFLDGKSELKSTLQTGMNTLTVLQEIKRQLAE
ncbi:Gfo/Idh/MocA family protein [Treponema sp. C6A8]|uniref:Gfo/Idh/MocA family protein n=1 Tax=Treponema sp. C6A8 TaxID=1410609 RepID=UPI0004881EFC|nr:Gfo/Idh/MocA family oxidoreductase [Treponema sp. C6A8]